MVKRLSTRRKPPGGGFKYLRSRPHGTAEGDQDLSCVLTTSRDSLSTSEVWIMEFRTAQINLIAQSPPIDIILGTGRKRNDGVLYAFAFDEVKVQKAENVYME